MAKIFKLKKLSLLVKPDGFEATQAFQEIFDNRLKFDSWNLFLGAWFPIDRLIGQ